MDFQLSEEEEAFRQEVVGFLDEHLPEGQGRTPEFQAKWTEAIREKRWVGFSWPEDVGGGGGGIMEQVILKDEMAKKKAPALGSCFMGLAWVGPSIIQYGTEEQKQKYIPDILDGKYQWCTGYSEPDSGSDLASLKCKCEREGDEYVVNGSKLYITNGPVADICLLYVKTDMAKGAHGITALVVDMHSPGVTVAQKMIKMGFRGSQTAELVFEDCRVPVENVIGKENEGVKCVMSGLDLERATISPICVGMAERALDLSVAHAKERKQFGEPIANFQMIQSRLADMVALVETMKIYNYHALAMLNDLAPGDGGRGPVHKIAATSVMYCANALNEVLDHASQIHGGVAYMWETEINRIYRGIKLLEIGAGTTEVRKMIIAEELLKS